MDKKSIWPDKMADKIFTGFSDEELEMISKPSLSGYDDNLPYKPPPFQLYWTAELYSFGRCYRQWLNLPSWLPLPLYGDHGVELGTSWSSHEQKSKTRLHLTWYKERLKHLKSTSKKKVIRIPHPWIIYRKTQDIKQSANARGTLIFYPHTVMGIDFFEFDDKNYFNTLKELPQEYHPLVICMHMHDIRKGYHRTARNSGIPIISAGETSSPFFVDRFYDLIAKFKYSTSNKGGSELFYAEELGVKYFIFGKEPIYYNFYHNEAPIGPLPMDIPGDVQKKVLFSELPPKHSAEKVQFVTDALGLDVDHRKAMKAVQKQLLIEYFRHLPEIFAYTTFYLIKKIIPKKIKKFIKKYSKVFKRNITIQPKK